MNKDDHILEHYTSKLINLCGTYRGIITGKEAHITKSLKTIEVNPVTFCRLFTKDAVLSTELDSFFEQITAHFHDMLLKPKEDLILWLRQPLTVVDGQFVEGRKYIGCRLDITEV